jgi:hypothetical protein
VARSSILPPSHNIGTWGLQKFSHNIRTCVVTPDFGLKQIATAFLVPQPQVSFVGPSPSERAGKPGLRRGGALAPRHRAATPRRPGRRPPVVPPDLSPGRQAAQQHLDLAGESRSPGGGAVRWRSRGGANRQRSREGEGACSRRSRGEGRRGRR